MNPAMIDLGWAMARLEITALETTQPGEKKLTPMLTICWPGGDDIPSGAVQLWDEDGLHNLRDALAAFLDSWDNADEEIPTGD